MARELNVVMMCNTFAKILARRICRHILGLSSLKYPRYGVAQLAQKANLKIGEGIGCDD
jgi:hypothetical protein